MKSIPFAKVKPKKKLRSMKTLKREAWKAFAKAMRRKGADSYSGLIACITCERQYHFTNSAWNAGHFKHGKWKMSGFYENNVWPQCVFCNCGGGTNGGGDMVAELYENALEFKLGREEVEKIKHMSKQLWKPTREELEAIIAKYKLDGLEGA